MTAKIEADILEIMKDSGYNYSVGYLAKRLQVSKVTIRKSIKVLKEKILLLSQKTF